MLHAQKRWRRARFNSCFGRWCVCIRIEAEQGHGHGVPANAFWQKDLGTEPVADQKSGRATMPGTIVTAMILVGYALARCAVLVNFAQRVHVASVNMAIRGEDSIILIHHVGPRMSGCRTHARMGSGHPGKAGDSQRQHNNQP